MKPDVRRQMENLVSEGKQDEDREVIEQYADSLETFRADWLEFAEERWHKTAVARESPDHVWKQPGKLDELLDALPEDKRGFFEKQVQLATRVLANALEIAAQGEATAKARAADADEIFSALVKMLGAAAKPPKR